MTNAILKLKKFGLHIPVTSKTAVVGLNFGVPVIVLFAIKVNLTCWNVPQIDPIYTALPSLACTVAESFDKHTVELFTFTSRI